MANSQRTMAAVALGIVTRHGKPIFLKAFDAEKTLKYHFIVHAALDYFDDKQALEKSSYLGNIAHIEDYRLFGFVANSGIQIVLCTDDGKSVSKQTMKQFFDRVQQAYIDYAASPFVNEDSTIVSESFDAKIHSIVQHVFPSS